MKEFHELFHIEQKWPRFSLHPSKSLPVKFQQKNSRGGRRQSSYWANKQQWTSQIKNNQGNQHIKTASISSKIRGNPSLNSVHQYTHQPFIHPPHHTHPEERIWAGRTPPAEAPGPGRSEDQARQDETILHDWHGAKKVVILSCQKMRIPLAREGKISLAMKNKTIQRTKIEFAKGWQTRGT